MTFVIMRKTTLQQQIETAVNQAFKTWVAGDGTGDDRGLCGEFDSLHSRIRSLQLETKKMQSKIDAFRDLIAQVSAKVDELKAKGEGIPVDVFAQLTDDLKAVLAKLG
jgi:hypothetical protein